MTRASPGTGARPPRPPTHTTNCPLGNYNWGGLTGPMYVPMDGKANYIIGETRTGMARGIDNESGVPTLVHVENSHLTSFEYGMYAHQVIKGVFKHGSLYSTGGSGAKDAYAFRNWIQEIEADDFKWKNNGGKACFRWNAGKKGRLTNCDFTGGRCMFGMGWQNEHENFSGGGNQQYKNCRFTCVDDESTMMELAISDGIWDHCDFTGENNIGHCHIAANYKFIGCRKRKNVSDSWRAVVVSDFGGNSGSVHVT